MNMCIIIVMNIYITKDNEEYLANLTDDWTKSGLINYLLRKHRGDYDPDDINKITDPLKRPTPAPSEKKPTLNELQAVIDNIPSKPSPSAEEFACCKQGAPCKHWQFNDLDGSWVNQRTGETRETL